MTVSYALTDRTVALFADRELFADEARLEPLARIEPPPSRELFYGDRLSFDRGSSVWFQQHDRMREATCEAGATDRRQARALPPDRPASPATLLRTCNGRFPCTTASRFPKPYACVILTLEL